MSARAGSQEVVAQAVVGKAAVVACNREAAVAVVVGKVARLVPRRREDQLAAP